MRLAVHHRWLSLVWASMTAAMSVLALSPLAGIAQEREPKPSVEKGAAPAAGQSLSQLGWLAGTWHSESQDGGVGSRESFRVRFDRWNGPGTAFPN